MVNTPDGLWLCVNPHLSSLDQRLCEQLNHQVTVESWMYQQSADTPCCMEAALASLHAHIQHYSEPVHLLGHGLSGALGLLYARLFAGRICSLTLFSVGANPAVSWQAHYYALRKFLPCSRETILMQMARMLVGPQDVTKAVGFAALLKQVLDTELAPDSLADHSGFSPGGIEPPLLICHGSYDAIVDPKAHQDWRQWIKPGDRLWSCPQGRHFFHYDHPECCSRVILEFWQQTSSFRLSDTSHLKTSMRLATLSEGDKRSASFANSLLLSGENDLGKL